VIIIVVINKTMLINHMSTTEIFILMKIIILFCKAALKYVF